MTCETQPKRPCGNSPEFLRELGLVVHAVVELPFDVDVDGPRRLRVLPGDGRIDANLSVARSRVAVGVLAAVALIGDALIVGGLYAGL